MIRRVRSSGIWVKLRLWGRLGGLGSDADELYVLVIWDICASGEGWGRRILVIVILYIGGSLGRLLCHWISF